MKTNLPWRRRIVLALIATLIAVGLYLGLRPQAIEVDIASARRAPLQVTLEQEGRTRVRERYVVTAPVNGYARRIAFEAGQMVERGTVLAELEPMRAPALDPRQRAQAQARIASAQASVNIAAQQAKAANSNAALAQSELQRVRTLRPQGYISAATEERAASEVQRSAAELRASEFAVSTAQHELEAARAALQYAASPGTEKVAVRAPVTGSILRVIHKSEGTVASGQPLLEIGDPSALEVEVDLLSADAVRIHPGTRVVFERWGGAGALEGAVRVIEPAGFTKVSALGVEEQRVWVIVAFTSAATRWQRLGDGYRVEASFILWEGKDILQIPASALFRDKDGWALYVIEQGKAIKRAVQSGQGNGLVIQITSGIKAGEQVIAHPDDRVRDGVSVTARK
jgi:HlyD family secretion protein